MSQPTLELLKVPCTIVIKMDGKKIVKQIYGSVSELLYDLRGPLETKATYKIAKKVYQK